MLPSRRFVPLGIACLLQGTSAASPLSDGTSGQPVFTGVATPHATSLFINPASLGPGTPASHFYAAMAATADHISIDRDLVDPDTGVASDGPRVNQITPSPGATVALWTSGRGLSGGILVSVPPAHEFMSDRSALRYHTQGGGHRVSQLATIGGAARILSRFHVGAAVSITRTDLRLAFARDLALAAGNDPLQGIGSSCGGATCGLEAPLASESYRVDVASTSILDSSNLVFTLGVLIGLGSDWHLGVSYRTRGTAVTLSGDATVHRSPRDVANDPSAAAHPTPRGHATVSMDLVPTLEAEVRGKLSPGLELHVGGRWDNQSRFDNYDVRLFGPEFREAGTIPEWIIRPRGYIDPVRLWAGVEQIDHGQTVILGGRFGVKSPELAESAISATTIDGISVSADLGVQLRLGSARLQLGYGLEFFPTVDVSVDDSAYDPRAQLACTASGHDYSTAACQAVRDGYALPTAAASYRRLLHTFRLGVRYDL
jgi:hypothetical protein